MRIQTQRLVIRKFETSDAQNLFELDTDPEVMKFIGSQMPQTIEDTIAGINRHLENYKKHSGFGIFPAELADTNEFIGWCALKHLDSSDKIEVGYRLKKKYWGKGYATELTRALLKYAFEDLKLTEVFAVIQPGNSASEDVLIKSGLKFTGTGNYYNRDLKVFKIENQEYKTET